MKFSSSSYQKIAMAFAVLIAGVFLYFQQDNFPGSISLYLGIIFFPYLAIRTGTPTGRLLLPILLGLLTLVFVKTASLYYLVAGLSLLYLLEISWGKLNPLAFLLLVIVAPLFRYITHIWSFPIRLEMSKVVAKTLSGAGFDVSAVGNTIMVKGAAYEVEPGCIGLKMIGTAMVCCLLLLAYFVRKKGWRATWTSSIVAMIIGLLLTVFANYVRMLGLVLFNILPATIMHDLMGILSLSVYVILPFYFGLSWWTKGKATVENSDYFLSGKWKHPNLNWYRKRLGLAGLILVGLVGTGFQFQKEVTHRSTDFSRFGTFDNYTETIEGYGVLKLSKPDEVIYIKPPAGPFQGVHDPRICWEGSGFEFYKIRKSKIGDLSVYLAEIQKDDLILETAWWYDNGKVQTTEEWYWRWWTLMKQEDFYLINVSVPKGENLENAVQTFLSK